jgi:CRISPR system Cascade subunit CasE
MVQHLTRTLVRLTAPCDAYRMHQAVAAATSGRSLWAQPEPGVLIIQSDKAVDWTVIPGALSATTCAVTVTFPSGARVEFGWIAHPVRRISRTTRSVPPGRSGEHTIPAAEREAWAVEKLAPALKVTAITGQPLPAARGSRQGAPLTLARHLLIGHATVTDPDETARLTTTGLGRGKAFGCGLLTLALTRGVA